MHLRSGKHVNMPDDEDVIFVSERRAHPPAAAAAAAADSSHRRNAGAGVGELKVRHASWRFKAPRHRDVGQFKVNQAKKARLEADAAFEVEEHAAGAACATPRPERLGSKRASPAHNMRNVECRANQPRRISPRWRESRGKAEGRRALRDVTNQKQAPAVDDVAFVPPKKRWPASPAPAPGCGICDVPMSASNRCTLGCCTHKFCGSCVAMHVKVKVNAQQWPVRCPGERCTEHLDSWQAAKLLRDEDMSQEADALERMALEKAEGTTLKHCSNPECGCPFDYDGDSNRSTARVDCPLCKTATCVLCNKAWHEGPCARTPEEEALLKDERFRACPKCDTFIERSDGCNFVRCHCGAGFCFRCGLAYLSLKPTSTNEHGTPACNCTVYQGTIYEPAVDEARRRFAEWKAQMPLSEKKKDNWQERERVTFRQMFREEHKKVRDAHRNGGGGGAGDARPPYEDSDNDNDFDLADSDDEMVDSDVDEDDLELLR